MHNKGPVNKSGANGRPTTSPKPAGGYGSYGTPMKGMRTSAVKSKPSGGRKGHAANKPKGGFGSLSSAPTQKVSTPMQSMVSYAADGMATPKTPIPSDQVKGRFNLPKGKFV